MSEPVIHWDDVGRFHLQQGPLDAFWTNLGQTAGCINVDLRRIEIQPGGRSTPVHQHAGEEEIFFVLGGSGLSWQDGETFEVGAGDSMVHATKGPAHTLIAGPAGLDVLVFCDRVATESCFLPRAKVAWLGSTWVKAGETSHPFAQEVAAGELPMPDPSPRPASIVNVDQVEAAKIARGEAEFHLRDLGRAIGSQRTGLRHLQLTPSKAGFPPHCHSCEEELFVVLEGGGQLELQGPGVTGWAPDVHPIRSGSIVAMPAGTGIAHGFRAGEKGLSVLAYGPRDGADVIWYPRSAKVYFAGLRICGRIEPLEYWDGEE